MKPKKIFLDLGHGPHNGKGGAFDPGAEAFGTSEYAECRKLLSKLDMIFAGMPFEVVQTPELSIREVTAWVNESAGPSDILLALHLNSAGPKASGSEVIYSYTRPHLLGKAEQLSKALSSALKIPNRGAVVDSDTPAGKLRPNGNKGLPMVRDTACAAFILEPGFISNFKELKQIRVKGQTALCDAIKLAASWDL